MAEGRYSRRNIEEQFKQLSTVARDACFPDSEPGILTWIAFYVVKSITFR